MMNSCKIRTWMGTLLLVALATGVAQCDCDPAQNCVLDEECAGMTWTEDCQGHWACVEGSCTPVCDDTCDAHEDCVGLDWPLGDPRLDCTEADGHWECEANVCVAYCNEDCTTFERCMLRDWPETCGGHWSCELGHCVATCDAVGCGDNTCAPGIGETETSCPADCLEPCASVAECLDRTWALPCAGVWTCAAGACVGACDYTQCGDGQCDPAAGEDGGGCPDDCLTSCGMPQDCLGTSWNQLCQGHWNCFAGACQPVCDSVRCGDGACMAGQGEDGLSCAADCLAGPCSEPVDCAAYAWPEVCGGRWSCTGTGACQTNCEATCGDATCDVLGGETPDSCPQDCGGHACRVSPDCAALTLPAGCEGEFLCVERVCRPVCD